MCGIAGYVDFASRTPVDRILRAMTVSLRRRGPDASGTMIDGPCGLAHTRLSILDLESSRQPMRAGGCAVSLVYNGELYNYVQLREDLRAQGATISTHGDTEVLLQWIDREWTEALPRFDGMFGFAAWHRDRQRLLLARDPLGIKPVFYTTPAPGVIVFGSEIKALFEHPAVKAEVDPDALRQVLRFRAVYGDGSLYRGVRQLRPGHYLEFDNSGLRIGCYYDLDRLVDAEREGLKGLSREDLVREGEKRFERAVRKRLVADVPVGSFLSGGLDSSLIVATIKRCRAADEETCTFSVGFQNDEHSELPFARTVAEALGTRHTEVPVTQDDYMSTLCELTGCRDAPISEPQDLAIARMSEVARQTVKVVLSGEGGDEVFAGYPKYRFAEGSPLWRTALRAVGPERAARLAGILGLDRRRALVAARALAQPREIDRLVCWYSNPTRREWQELFPGLGWSDDQWGETVRELDAILQNTSTPDPVARMQAVDCLSWLPGNLLERGDRMTMSAGLEMRVPFLDKHLVPFGLALPSRLKVKGSVLKWIVRRWADGQLPGVIINRPKCGFGIPLAEWFRGHLRSMLSSYLDAPHGVCQTYGDPGRIRALLEAHGSGKVDANRTLWTILALEVWYQDVYLARRNDETEQSIDLTCTAR